jgi:tRNA threonylcarbamoyl adenosine modification protein (Sua5/YciO/YrdC/YwlC family)
VRRLPFVEPDEVLAALSVAVGVISDGGVVVVPTESFYGLAADPRRDEAVRLIHALKGRPADLGLPVLCADWQQVESLVEVPERFRVKLSRIWPSALTVVLAARESIPAAAGGTLAVRIPGHQALRALLYRSGPVTGTSANGHGKPPAVMVDDAVASMTSAPDLALDAGQTAGGDPSTIVDLTGDRPRVVRSGRVRWDDPYPES